METDDTSIGWSVQGRSGAVVELSGVTPPFMAVSAAWVRTAHTG
jgi:hypothetical protein